VPIIAALDRGARALLKPPVGNPNLAATPIFIVNVSAPERAQPTITTTPTRSSSQLQGHMRLGIMENGNRPRSDRRGRYSCLPPHVRHSPQLPSRQRRAGLSSAPAPTASRRYRVVTATARLHARGHRVGGSCARSSTPSRRFPAASRQPTCGSAKSCGATIPEGVASMTD